MFRVFKTHFSQSTTKLIIFKIIFDAIKITGASSGFENNLFGGPWSQKGWTTLQYRGVQYVHCVIVKVGGNKIHIKYVRKNVNFPKTGENF